MMIRAFQLQIGDIFIRGGGSFKVNTFTTTTIICRAYYNKEGANRQGAKIEIGRNSKERIELINHIQSKK